jgi:predicted permease
MHELQVRAALGARRFRLVRQLLTEAFVLGILGAAAGWLCARQIVALLLSTLPATEAAARFEFHADPRVLVFMAASTFVTVLGFSVLPVWRASRVNVSTALKASGHGTQRVGRRLALLTVGVQMALSIVLLAGAAMFVQTVRNASTMSLGFDRRDLIEVELADRVLRLNASEVHQIHTALFEGLRAIPGVKVVALSYPFFPSWAFGIEKPEGEAGYRTSVDYFAAMRIPLLRGRLLTEADADREDPVVVVNDWYARGWFPGDDAIGKRGGFNNALIVGVVGNAATTNVRWDDPTVYRLARASEARLAPALVVRTAAGIERTTLFRPIEQVVRRVNPRLFVAVRTPDDALNRSIARERMVAATSSLFAFAGIVLAGVGLFGVAASAVAHRSVELGLRAALGASRWQIIREALRGTAIAITAGVAAGIAITAVVSRQLGHFISGLLIGLGPSDWMVLTSAAAAMLTVALVASVVPAIRAGRIDPLETMRRT